MRPKPRASRRIGLAPGWLVLALSLAAGGSAAGAPDAGPAHPAPFLWEVQGPAAKHYLLGSVHLLPPSAYPLPAALEAAYATTGALVLEADLSDLAAPALQARMLGAARDDRPGGLKARIGPSLYAKLQKRAAALGMPTPACETLRAWFCALTLELLPLQQADFSPEYGIDQHFFARARDDGRPIAGLETAEEQIDLLATMPEAVGRQLLAATLDESTYTSQSPEELHRIWRNGDMAALEDLLKGLRQHYPELDQRILAGRNRAWLPRLVERFGGATPQLVIVGAAHLAGREGLLTLLKGRGFEPRPATAVIEAGPSPGT